MSTGLPQSTAHRLASELVAWGGLERVDGGGYQIGLRLWEIGALAVRGESVREIALPFMHDLFDAAHENVQLAILDGTQAVYIAKITGRARGRSSEAGGRLPLHATGVGKVLLAYGSDDLLAAVLANGLTRYTAHTIVLPGHLRRALTKVRREGVAFANDEMSMGSVSVASPLLAAEGSAVAALDVVVRADRSDLRRLATAVQATANSVSRILQQGGAGRSVRAQPVLLATVNATLASMAARLYGGHSQRAGASRGLPISVAKPRLRRG